LIEHEHFFTVVTHYRRPQYYHD